MEENSNTRPGPQLVEAKQSRRKRGRTQPHAAALAIAADTLHASRDLFKTASATNMREIHVLLGYTLNVGYVARRALEKARLALELLNHQPPSPALVVREFIQGERIGPQSATSGVFIERRRA